MRDWNSLIERRLGKLKLPKSQREEVTKELAAHLEDLSEDENTSGIRESESTAATDYESTDWSNLANDIQKSKRGNYFLNSRSKTFWLPALVTLTAVQIFWAILISNSFSTLASLVEVPRPIIFLAALPLFGAIGAYLSRRGGGNRTARIVAGIFPWLVIFALMAAIFFANFLTGHAPFAGYQHLHGWILLFAAALVPTLALLIGALPFTRGATIRFMAVILPLTFILTHTSPVRAQSQNANTTTPSFEYEIASIKLNKSITDNRPVMNYTADGFIATGVPLIMLIQSAYGIFDTDRISGAPAWLNSERFDIDAKMDSAAVDALKNLSPADRTLARQRMLQSLLAERFKLTIHRDTKELPAYTLVIAKNGSKLQEAKPGDTYSNGYRDGGGRGGPGTVQLKGRGGLVAQDAPIANLAGMLSWLLGHNVVDRTGLTGKYDFTLQWTPDEGESPILSSASSGTPSGQPSPPPPDPNGPSLATALEEQLGLKLESKKGPVEIIVIDHVEKPSGN